MNDSDEIFVSDMDNNRIVSAEVTGSNPVEALIFFRLPLSNCLNWKIHCDDHSSLLRTIPTIIMCWEQTVEPRTVPCTVVPTGTVKGCSTIHSPSPPSLLQKVKFLQPYNKAAMLAEKQYNFSLHNLCKKGFSLHWRETLLFLSTNVATVTSPANQQLKKTLKFFMVSPCHVCLC